MAQDIGREQGENRDGRQPGPDLRSSQVEVEDPEERDEEKRIPGKLAGTPLRDAPGGQGGRGRGLQLQAPRSGGRRDVETGGRHDASIAYASGGPAAGSIGYNDGVKIPAALRRRPWMPLELALAVLLLVWRCLAPTWHPVYLDLLFYLGLYWVFLILDAKADRVETLTAFLMIALFGIYLRAQMPHWLVLVDLLP